jgi:hypothetical protein
MSVGGQRPQARWDKHGGGGHFVSSQRASLFLQIAQNLNWVPPLAKN